MFNGLAVLSLVLCVALMVLWPLGHRRSESWWFTTQDRTTGFVTAISLENGKGWIVVSDVRTRLKPVEPGYKGWHHGLLYQSFAAKFGGWWNYYRGDVTNKKLDRHWRMIRVRVALSTALTAILPLTWFAWAIYQRRKRRVPGYCLHCGYNLTGNISGVCPECGKPIALKA